MAGNQILSVVEAAIDPAASEGLPATAYELPLQSTAGQVRIIWYPGDPSAGVAFANVPNGTIVIDTTNDKIWKKTGNLGSGIGGGWKSSAFT